MIINSAGRMEEQMQNRMQAGFRQVFLGLYHVGAAISTNIMLRSV